VVAALLLSIGPAAAADSEADTTSVVKLYGNLSVNGSQVVDQNGLPVRLQGMSMFWSMWMDKYWTADTVQWLKDDWNISIIRLAMGVENSKGYLDDPKTQKKLVTDTVDAAIEAGLYVIIDWHDHHATDHVDEAMEFFGDMAKSYGKYPNVLFETFNEPMDQPWSDIKDYHQQVVDVIREHTDNIIILGNEAYSSGVVVAAEDPVNGTNLAYTLHFYAASHKQTYRDKILTAMEMGVAIMVTEWGVCDYSGNGTLDFDSTRTWMDFLEEQNISSMNWAVSDKFESCSALLPGASPKGNWSAANLTYSGKLVRHLIQGADAAGDSCDADGWPCTAPECAAKDAGCKDQECCTDEGEFCYKKNDGWSQCMSSCTPGIHATDPKQFRTPWSCEILGQPAPGPPWTIVFEGRRYVALDVVLIVGILLMLCFIGVIVYLCLKRNSSSEYQQMQA